MNPYAQIYLCTVVTIGVVVLAGIKLTLGEAVERLFHITNNLIALEVRLGKIHVLVERKATGRE